MHHVYLVPLCYLCKFWVAFPAMIKVLGQNREKAFLQVSEPIPNLLSMLTANNVCSNPCILQLFHLQPPVSALSNKAGDKTNKKSALTSKNHILNNMARRLHVSHIVYPQVNPMLRSFLSLQIVLTQVETVWTSSACQRFQLPSRDIVLPRTFRLYNYLLL